MSSEDWIEEKLENCANFQEGYVNPSKKIPEYFGDEIKWIRANDLNNSYVYDTTKKLSRKGFESSGKSALLFKPNTIVISKSGTIGRLGIIKDYMCGNRATINISPIGNICNLKYLFYWLLRNQRNIENMAVGSVQRNLYVSLLSELKILLPPLPEQKAIAKVLSDLDDKIELNNEMNKKLEEIGQALFKRWFIDFDFLDENGNPYRSSGGEMVYSKELGKEIPKGWKVGKLGDYVILVKGVSYKSEELSESENALVTLKSIDRGGNYNTDGLKEYVGKYKNEQILFSGDIVVAHTDLTQKADVLGKPAIIREDSNHEKLIASLDLVIVRPKSEHISRPFIYHLLKTNIFHNHAIGYANGTTVLHLNQRAIPDFQFVVPSFTVTQTFGEIINKITLKLQDNELQSEYLAELRDSLLPKLMSGEIRVPLEAAQ